jgi:lipoate-protein ligase B
MAYDAAYAEQALTHERVLSGREAVDAPLGEILLVEHDPVITVTRKAREAGNVLATPQMLAHFGVALHDTDRGGDVTYHGPGQLVVYPIVDLNRLNLGLHAYMRCLEGAVINTLASLGVVGVRDASATGVWVPGPSGEASDGAKIAAMGVRLRKWVSMHGLALNVVPDMSHFNLIVPCGLVGRPVTSLKLLLGDAAPTMDQVKPVLVDALTKELMGSLGGPR